MPDNHADPESSAAIAEAEGAWQAQSEHLGPLPDEARSWFSRALRAYRSSGSGSVEAWISDITASVDEAASEIKRGPVTSASAFQRVRAKYRGAVE